MTKDPADRLADVLGRENEALEQANYVAAVALMPEKEAALAAMSQGPRPADKQIRLLDELAGENRVLLERAIAVQTEAVRIIALAYVTPRTMGHYNRNGGSAITRRPGALALSTNV